MVSAADVRAFWVDEVGVEGWFRRDAAVDAAIAERFGAATEAARAGGFEAWRGMPEDAMALLILLDQFPRNLHRGAATAFAADARAREEATAAIDAGHDLAIPEPERLLFYLPLMHSETPADQERCFALVTERLPLTQDKVIPSAIEHRDAIRRFGRFPYRNAALGRENTAEEAQWLGDMEGKTP